MQRVVRSAARAIAARLAQRAVAADVRIVARLATAAAVARVPRTRAARVAAAVCQQQQQPQQQQWQLMRVVRRAFASAGPAPHRVVTMPSLSPTMTEGKIAKWNVAVGAEVSAGDVICSIETDKATLDVECQEDGFVARILAPAGDSMVAVNQPILVLAEEKGDVGKFESFTPEGTAAAAAAAPAPKAEEEPKKAEPAPQAPAAPKEQQPAPPSPAPQQATSSGRVMASPAARNLAAEKGVPLEKLTGSGPHGRIVLKDVEAAVEKGLANATAARGPATAAAAPAAVAAAATGSFTDVPLTAMRRVIAQRLTESKQSIPHYYLSVDCEVDRLMGIRAQLNANAPTKISVNDFIVKASAIALQKVPECNNSWQGSAIRVNHSVDISVAVQTESGLITPIVGSAHHKGLVAISTATKDLAERARANKLKPAEYQGGTFTISNLGMFGISHFTAVINPPQACILAVGAARPVLVPDTSAAAKKDGADSDDEGVVARVAQVMTVTLSCDHRVVDGAVGARWLQEFKSLIEDPVKMLM